MNRPYKTQRTLSHLEIKTIRPILGLYVLAAWLIYDFYALRTYQQGFRLLTNGDIGLFILLVCGSALCLLARMALYCMGRSGAANRKDAIPVTLWQLLLLAAFLSLTAKVLGFTHGRLDFYGIRVYSELEYSVFLMVGLQVLGDLIRRGVLKFASCPKQERARIIFAVAICLVGICIFGTCLYREVFFTMDYLIRVISRME